MEPYDQNLSSFLSAITCRLGLKPGQVIQVSCFIEYLQDWTTVN